VGHGSGPPGGAHPGAGALVASLRARSKEDVRVGADRARALGERAALGASLVAGRGRTGRGAWERAARGSAPGRRRAGRVARRALYGRRAGGGGLSAWGWNGCVCGAGVCGLHEGGAVDRVGRMR